MIKLTEITLTIISIIVGQVFTSNQFLKNGASPIDPNIRTVGILTMPPLTETERKHLGHSHYILEMADAFMRSGGLYGIMIPFNATDEDLYSLLD